MVFPFNKSLEIRIKFHLSYTLWFVTTQDFSFTLLPRIAIPLFSLAHHFPFWLVVDLVFLAELDCILSQWCIVLSFILHLWPLNGTDMHWNNVLLKIIWKEVTEKAWCFCFIVSIEQLLIIDIVCTIFNWQLS